MDKVYLLQTLNWAGDDHILRPDLGAWTNRKTALVHIQDAFGEVTNGTQIVEIEINDASSENEDLLAKIESLNERIEELKEENSQLYEENSELKMRELYGPLY